MTPLSPAPPPFDARAAQIPIFDALVQAAGRAGMGKPILEDQERSPLTYLDLIRASFALGRKLKAMTTRGEAVGVLLPSSAGVVVTFFALHAFGRTPTMLNFTAGVRNLQGACKVAGVKRVLTARRFIEQGGLQDLVTALAELAEVTYLEDVRKTVGAADKLFAAAAGAAPLAFRTRTRASDPGVILFTSGSFGTPKGVVLSQANLVSNARQIASHIYLDPDWVMFNPLPTFHCFGLTAGALLPLLAGLKAFQYPSPLHTKQIPELIRDSGAAVLFGTDTFVGQYARAAQPEQLSGLKFVVCGAEKVREETHLAFKDKFGGVPVLEGYGATECAPVIAVNTPGDNRWGTVGGLLPGMETRLEAAPGIEGGVLHVRGPNVMSGYLTAPTRLEPPRDGWHDTGDVVTITPDNWVSIVGRVKRFAKIGGEMVSLAAVEAIAEAAWPDHRHAVVALPDPRKGERLVLVTDRADAAATDLLSTAQALGAPELAVPRRIIAVPEVPLLGTGKTDYVAVRDLAEGADRKAA